MVPSTADGAVYARKPALLIGSICISGIHSRGRIQVICIVPERWHIVFATFINRYRVPRASDLPLWKLEVEVLPPLGPTDVPKGIAEVVMIPIVPALLNAIYDATGRRFTKVPVTAASIREALG